MSYAGTDITVDDLYDSADENKCPAEVQQNGGHQQTFTENYWMWLGEVELEDSPLKTLVPVATDLESQCSSAETGKTKSAPTAVNEPFKPPRELSHAQQTPVSAMPTQIVSVQGNTESGVPSSSEVKVTVPVDNLSQSSRSDAQDSVADTFGDGGRVMWTDHETTLLLDGYNQVKAHSSVRNGFKQNQHKSVAKFIAANGGRTFSAKQVQQKYDRVKKGYRQKKK